VFATRTVAADRTQMFAARQGVIRRIRRDRFALAAGRRTQEVAVTTSIEGSLHAKQRTIVYEIYAATTVACTFSEHSALIIDREVSAFRKSRDERLCFYVNSCKFFFVKKIQSRKNSPY